MVALASLPNSVTVTNDLAESLVLHHGTRLEPSVATVVTLDGRADGEKTDIWNALRIAQQEGHISSGTTFDPIDDPVDSPHTTFGGQEALGAIADDSL